MAKLTGERLIEIGRWGKGERVPEAHWGFGFPQSTQFLLPRSSRLMRSWRVFFAVAWSIEGDRRQGREAWENRWRLSFPLDMKTQWTKLRASHIVALFA